MPDVTDTNGAAVPDGEGPPKPKRGKPRVLRSPRSEVILGECPRGAPRGAPRICDERCCAHSVIVEDCRWGWQNNKNDSDNNNGNDDDSINNNSKQKQQQLRIHVRRIPLGGFPLLPFNPALGERPRVPRRGHPAVLSASESLLAEASRKTLMRWYCCTIAAGVQARMPWNRIIPGHPRRTSRR
jgi:hypothetical protein